MLTSGKPMSLLSVKIRTARQLKDFDPYDLATRLKLSPSTIYTWETGKYKPSRKNIENLARVFDVPVVWFDDQTSFDPMFDKVPFGKLGSPDMVDQMSADPEPKPEPDVNVSELVDQVIDGLRKLGVVPDTKETDDVPLPRFPDERPKTPAAGGVTTCGYRTARFVYMSPPNAEDFLKKNDVEDNLHTYLLGRKKEIAIAASNMKHFVSDWDFKIVHVVNGEIVEGAYHLMALRQADPHVRLLFLVIKS